MEIYSTTNPEYFYNTDEIGLIFNNKNWLKEMIYRPVLPIHNNILSENNINLSYEWDHTADNLILIMSSNIHDSYKTVGIKIPSIDIAEALYNAIEKNINVFKDQELESALRRLTSKFLSINNVITNGVLYDCNGYIYNENDLIGTFDCIKFGGVAKSYSEDSVYAYYTNFNNIYLFNTNYCISLNYAILLDKTILSNAKKNIKIYAVIGDQRIAINFVNQYDIVILERPTDAYDNTANGMMDLGVSLCPKDLVLPSYEFINKNIDSFPEIARNRRKLIVSQKAEDISEQFNFLL